MDCFPRIVLLLVMYTAQSNKVDAQCSDFCFDVCLFDGKCLCRVGFTGPNARYSEHIPGAVEADHCNDRCFPNVEYPPCVSWPCHEACNGVYGFCLATGRCLCNEGLSGPYPEISKFSRFQGRVEAEYCEPPTAKDETKCHDLCGSGVFHDAGKCQPSGRCLCWWGWTGDNAVYIKDGPHKGRILADFCTKACHFTPHVTNPNCGKV